VVDALLYGKLLWPQFVEVDGMVFREDDLETPEDFERVAAALKKYGSRAISELSRERNDSRST
jgi:hypothetical protein